MKCPRHNKEYAECGHLNHIIGDSENKQSEVNEYARLAEKKGLGDLSSMVWYECCKKYGFSGTKMANISYHQIMRVIFSLLVEPENPS